MEKFILDYTYVSSVSLSLLFSYAYLKIGRKVLAHSDGGGWDAGTSFSFIPELKYEDSIVYDGIFNTSHMRVKLLLILLNFIPYYAVVSFSILLTLVFTPLIFYFFDPNYRTSYAPKYVFKNLNKQKGE